MKHWKVIPAGCLPSSPSGRPHYSGSRTIPLRYGLRTKKEDITKKHCKVIPTAIPSKFFRTAALFQEAMTIPLRYGPRKKEEDITIKTLKGHTTGCSPSPSGRRIVSGSLDNTIKIWDGKKI